MEEKKRQSPEEVKRRNEERQAKKRKEIEELREKRAEKLETLSGKSRLEFLVEENNALATELGWLGSVEDLNQLLSEMDEERVEKYLKRSLKIVEELLIVKGNEPEPVGKGFSGYSKEEREKLTEEMFKIADENYLKAEQLEKELEQERFERRELLNKMTKEERLKFLIEEDRKLHENLPFEFKNTLSLKANDKKED